MFGACRLPDPTTAGDFLRRFNAGALAGLRQAIDAVQHKVWSKLARRHDRRRAKRSLVVVYLDGHLKELYGNQFEGADFSYKGRFSFNALVLTLAGTGECLAARLRPGNLRSSNGAAEVLDEQLLRLKEYFDDVLVVADSDFDRMVRWEWKRFRQAFVFIAAQVIYRARQVWLRFAGSHRFVHTLIAAHLGLSP
jgi:hypothetical protein